MNRSFELCLMALTVVAGAVAVPCTAQTLQEGIAVVMVPTANATPMPEADDPNAWIVAATSNEGLYFGLNKVTVESLLNEMKSRPRNREQKLYVKADRRAPYANIERILQAGRTVGFEAPVLLTSQPEQAAPGTIVPPKGLEVLVGAPSAGSIVVQVSKSEQASASLTVNGASVSDSALPSTLRRMLQNRGEKVVVVKGDGQLAFAQVAHVIDVCRSAGAKVMVAVAE